MKKIIIMLLTVVLVLSCAPNAFAKIEYIGANSQEEPSFTICADYTKSTNINLRITSGQATSTASITGYPGITTKVVITTGTFSQGLE
ncbi:MAG: hypothetical protein GX783_03740 [Clostridiales bacterium]|nr:hypothetical protein [Clostridiales bacterium]